MRHQIRLSLNIAGMALVLTLIKILIDIFIITQATQYVSFVFSGVVNHIILALSHFLITWRTDFKTRYVWLSSLIYTVLMLVSVNQHMIEKSFSHSILTRVLLFIFGAIMGIPASFVGSMLGKIPRRFRVSEIAQTDSG